MKYIYILILTVMVLSGCLDDKSNIEYHDVLVPDSVFVTDVSTGFRVRYEIDRAASYTVSPGQELQLNPEVFYRGDDEITYEWYSGGKLISTEKNLRYVFMKEAPECMLLVGRKNAGNGHCYQFSVDIRDPFAAGLVVLAKDNGKTLLDYVERYSERTSVIFQGMPQTVTLYKFELYNDVYANCNDGASLEGHDPVRLFRYSGYGYEEDPLVGIQIVDKDWRSSVSINSADMKKLVSMKDEFIDQPQNLQIVDFISFGSMSYLLTQSGEIYTRVNYDTGNPSTGRFSTFPLAYNDPNDVPDKGPIDIKADKLFFGTPSMSLGVALAYEKDRKRFLILSTACAPDMNSDYSYITDFSRPEGGVGNFPEHYADLNNFDKELISVIIPEQYSNNVYFLFKDGGNYYIQCCMIDGNMWSVPYDITNKAKSCDVLSSEIKTLLSSGNNYFHAANKKIYFSSGNKIYSMGYTGVDLKMEYESSGASPITKFSILKPWNEGTASPLNRYYGGRTFGVAFENGDVKVVKVYDDPDKPNKPQYNNLIEKHYNGGVVDLFFYTM